MLHGNLRGTEVRYHQVAVAVNQYVFRLEIAVYNAVRVKTLDREHELFFHKVLRHQDPSMDTTDADAVVDALTARGGRLAEAASAPSVEREPILASFETDYAAASRAHVLDVRAHVLQRVQGALEAQPELDLVDAVEAGAGLAYEHAHERADEHAPVATAGGFLLNLRAHVLRGADGLLHQNPEMDLDDIVSTKTRVKQAKLASRAISAGR